MTPGPCELAIRGGQVVTAAGVWWADLLVDGGRIAGLAAPGAGCGRSEVDAAGLHVLPGLVDAHVHIRFPGHPEREDVLSATTAAAAGGVTTVLEMPISDPGTATAEVLASRKELARDQATVDYAFYGGAGQDNLEHIAGLARAGVVGFKTFMHGPPPGREREFAGLCATDDGALLAVLQAVAATGRVAAVHAENDAVCRYLQGQLQARGRYDGLAHAEARPEAAELAAAATAIALAGLAGARLHLAHVSIPAVVDLAHAARAQGVDVTVETCPHYLAATTRDLERLGPLAKINPPLRGPRSVEGLWERVRARQVDLVASDHSPYRLEDKLPYADDIWRAPAGAPGLETMLPLLLSAVNGGRLALTDLVRLLASNPARRFGLYPRKGSLRPGADADLVLVDLGREQVIVPERMHTKARATARLFAGRRTVGAPVATMVRGRWVMRGGQVEPAPGYGRLLVPESGRECTHV